MNREEKFKYNNKFVEEVEDKIDVNELQYKKVNFWPLMRLELMRQLPSKNIKIQKKIKLDFFNYFQVIFDYFLFIIRSRKPKKVNTLFFSDKEFYYNEIKNKKINLFIDASYLFYKKSKLKIELIPTYSRNREKKYFEPIYIKILFYDFLRYLIKKIFFKNRFENKIVINKYFSDILKKYKKLNFDFKKLQKDLDNIIFESKLFEKFFKEYKCKKVYLTCYYQTKNFAIILACKHLGIKTIDIQHGAQEEYHLMYSRFKQSPKNGYNLLPDYFQVWERNQINNNFFLKKRKHHSYLIKKKENNLFWKKLENKENHKTHKSLKLFTNKLKRYDKIVLFCGSFQKLPKIIISLLKTNSKKIFWLIRFHPRHGNKERIISQLNSINKKNFDFYFSNKFDLSYFLKNSNLLIFENSSVVYDAIKFNLPSICISKNLFLMKKLKKYKKIKFLASEKKIKKEIFN